MDVADLQWPLLPFRPTARVVLSLPTVCLVEEGHRVMWMVFRRSDRSMNIIDDPFVADVSEAIRWVLSLHPHPPIA